MLRYHYAVGGMRFEERTAEWTWTATARVMDGATINRWISAMQEFHEWGESRPDGIGPGDHRQVENPADMGAMLERQMSATAEAVPEVPDEDRGAVLSRHDDMKALFED